MNIQEFRQQYPQYSDMSDEALAQSLHQKHYSDIAYDDFAQRFGVQSANDQNGNGLGLGLAREATQGLTFEFGDEIGHGLAAGAVRGAQMLGLAPKTGDSFSDIYRDMQDAYKAEREQFRGDHGGAALAANLGGALLSGGAGANLLRRAPQALSGYKGLAAVGGAEGALYGAGSADSGERLEGAVTGGALGATLAPTLARGAKAVSTAIGRNAATRSARNMTPTQEALRARANQTYKDAENLGVVLRPDKVQSIQQKLGAVAADTGFNPRIHPKVSAALDSFDDLAGQAPTLKRMEQQRRILGSAASSMEPDERRIASELIDQYDEIIGGLNAGDVVRGQGDEAAKVLAQARQQWQQTRKMQVIDEAIEKAKNQASGFENGMRTQLRSILNNPKKRRGFNQEEIQAMRRVVQGGTAENLMKLVGKFGFGEGQATSALGLSLGIAGGSAVGGGAGAVAVPLIGQAARKGAQRATRANVSELQSLIASGGSPKAIVNRYIREAGAEATPNELAQIFAGAERGDLVSLATRLNDLRGPQRKMATDALSIMAGSRAAPIDTEAAGY